MLSVVIHGGGATGTVRAVRLAHTVAVAAPVVEIRGLVWAKVVTVSRVSAGWFATVRTVAKECNAAGSACWPSNIPMYCVWLPRVSSKKAAT